MSDIQITFNSVCRQLLDRLEVYGYLGQGSYGTVFAARRKRFATGEFEHFALKVAEHRTLNKAMEGQIRPTMGLWEDGPSSRECYMPEEAVVMLFLGKSDRFPKIDSVYTHKAFSTIVMSSALDGDSRMNDEIPSQYDTRYRPYCGHSMIRQKKTLLNEVQACKIASQLLEAMVYLRDMGMCHDDLSHYNYLISEKLDVQLIDVGLVLMARTDEEWMVSHWITVPYQEYLVSPELAIEMYKQPWCDRWRRGKQCMVYLPHDARVEDQWKFSCIVFELLHGYAPWEESDWDNDTGGIRQCRSFLLNRHGHYDEARIDRAIEKVWLRRNRVVNYEFPIDEALSQDCVDVLRAMLNRNPARRPDPRAGMQELSSFPWFQGRWVDCGPFRRPEWPGDAQQSSI
ncbi:hypothetical protein VTN96DRAFT_4066 [Rasamsonia emersonii]